MDDEKKRVSNPYLQSNVFSKIFFCWLNPLFATRLRRPLEQKDLYDVLPEDSSHELCQRLARQWDAQLNIRQSGGSASLRKAIVYTFGLQYAVLGLLILLAECVKIFQALLLGALIGYFSSESSTSREQAYLYATGISLCALIKICLQTPFNYMMNRMGMWLRISCCALMYRKCLFLSNAALTQTTTGQIINIMSNDVKRFEKVTEYLHYFWVGTIQAVAVFALLWPTFGVATLAGMGFLILAMMMQFQFGRIMAKLRFATAMETDKRVMLMDELISSIHVIKLYCWEQMYTKLIETSRGRELLLLGRTNLARVPVHGLILTSSRVMCCLIFLVYFCYPSNESRNVTAELVFVTISLILPLQMSLTTFSARGIATASESLITVDRIQAFLLLDDMNQPPVIHAATQNQRTEKGVIENSDISIIAEHVNAAWNEIPTLVDVSFEVKTGQLLVIVGPVGCGKSSVLMTLLSELPISSGVVNITGSIAYVSQEPWILSGSIRQNIIFDKVFELEKYQDCIQAAALQKDLDILPNGDKTLVGEHGAVMSGGQKSRINLARALYQNSDIYLLDDPLSAVDASTGRSIFDRCIDGMLRCKVCVLITHQLQYIKQADIIMIMDQGHVTGRGTYDELTASGIDFTELLKEVDEDIIIAKVQDIMSNRTPAITGQNPNFEPARQNSQKHYSKSATSIQDMKYTESTPCGIRDKIRGYGSTRRHSQELLLEDSGIVISEDSSMQDKRRRLVSVSELEEESAESRDVGSVKLSIYGNYFWRGGKLLGCAALIIFNLMPQSLLIFSDWWLTLWISEGDKYAISMEGYTMMSSNTTIFSTLLPPEELDMRYYLYSYSAIILSVLTCSFFVCWLTYQILVNTAKNLHQQMLSSLMRSPMSFFYTTPSGRILNRFSKDMGIVDEHLPPTMIDFIQVGLMLLGVFIVAGSSNPWVLIPTIPVLVMSFITWRYFINTSRDIKRLEATSRSPVYSHVSATMDGLHTIRAFRAQESFMSSFHKYQDGHTSAFFLCIAITRWVAFRLEMLCTLFIIAVVFASIPAADSLSGGVVGLMVTYTFSLMGYFQQEIRDAAEVEVLMTSVQRIEEYCELPSEAPFESAPDKKPDDEWPKYGAISANEACLKYAQNGPMILKKLNFDIPAKSKVGIVGSTGAGKSSLISMLFRMTEPEGDIHIDGINIKELGLHDLRSHITIIPQNPVLLMGPVKRNIDQFNEHSDEELWKALDDVQLRGVVSNMAGRLDAEVSKGGTNFSVGQRQLICLARALLRKNKILIIDEATANVDERTDTLLQTTIRNRFAHCTVLTIAHRLHTVMDSDKIMLLDQGEILEFDHPHILLQNKMGALSTLVNQTGFQKAELIQIASQAYGSYLEKTDQQQSSSGGLEDMCATVRDIYDEQVFPADKTEQYDDREGLDIYEEEVFPEKYRSMLLLADDTDQYSDRKGLVNQGFR